MSSDESDASLSSFSDEDIMCSPCDLENMSSSSDEVDGSRGIKRQGPKYSFVKVKKTSETKHPHDTFHLEAFKDDLEAYFNGLTKVDGSMKFFPKSMEQFLASQHPTVLESLKYLDLKDVFVYLGSTFVVTLNMHNERIRIPSRVICDALVFSSNQAVLVLSFVKRQTDRVRRLDMYNNFVARGVTEALRTFLHDVSVVRGVVEEGTNLSSCLPDLENQTIFFHPISITMNKDKRDAALKAILRSVAVTQAATVYKPSAYDASGKGLYFLNVSEFEFLSQFIDMKSTTLMHTALGRMDIIALEIASRRSRSGKTAVHVHESGNDEALKAHRVKYPNLDVLTTGTDIECQKYEHIFADKMSHIKGDVKTGGDICIISSSKSDFRSLKKLTRTPSKRKSLFQIFSRKTATVNISQEPGTIRKCQSVPNLSTGPLEEIAYLNEEGITLVGHKPLTERQVKRSSASKTSTIATQSLLLPPSSLPCAEEVVDVRKCEPDIQIQRKSSTASESDRDYDQDSFVGDLSDGEGSRKPASSFSRTSSGSSGYVSSYESQRGSDKLSEAQDSNMDS